MPRHAPNPDEPLPGHLDPRGKHRGNRRWRSGAAATALSIGTLLSVALLVIAGYAFYTFRSINNGITHVQAAAIGQKPKGAPKYNGKDVNILLVGNDDRTNMTTAEAAELHVGKDGGSMATDTMMIVHVPADGKHAVLISLPRDSWVNIKGYGYGRLNSAYTDAFDAASGSEDAKRDAGANLLISTVSQLTGLTINEYAQVSLIGFYRLAKALGGITVNLCESVDDTVAYNEAHGQGDAGSGLVLSKGKHTLTPLQALEFVRQRHNLPLGDLDRVKRQQYFLTAAFRKVESVGVLTKLSALGSAITQSVYLGGSLTLFELGEQLENLSANNISGKTIPTSPQTIDGMDVLIVNQATVRAFVEKAIDESNGTSSSSSSSSSSKASSSGSSSGTKKTKKALDSGCID